MKIIAIVLCVLLLSGCGRGDDALESAMTLRSRILESEGCAFTAVITADYGDLLHTFTLDCEGDSQGAVKFVVSEPDTISGISGIIHNQAGNLTFDDTLLAFPLLADGQLSPVAAPYVFYETLRSGYLTSAGMEEDLIRISIDDRYEEDALQLDIWVDRDLCPQYCQILYNGRSILSLTIDNFRIL